MALAVLLVHAAHGLGQAQISTESRVQNAECQECHGVAGLHVADESSGESVSLTIDPPGYARSVHGELACTACHPKGYEDLPHHGPRRYPRYLCVDCHEGDPAVKELELPGRRDQLRESAHGRRAEQPLDCHDCHDPHLFRRVRDMDAALDRIALSNALCLACHGPRGGRLRGYADLPTAEQSHGYFPNPRAHFRKVKCVACHTPLDNGARHRVLPVADSIRECTQCHSRGSPVLRTSYERPSPDGGARPGAEDAVEDNAYVVGSTRSAALDRASLVGFGILVSLILAHAGARTRLRQRRSRRHR